MHTLRNVEKDRSERKNSISSAISRNGMSSSVSFASSYNDISRNHSHNRVSTRDNGKKNSSRFNNINSSGSRTSLSSSSYSSNTSFQGVVCDREQKSRGTRIQQATTNFPQNNRFRALTTTTTTTKSTNHVDIIINDLHGAVTNLKQNLEPNTQTESKQSLTEINQIQDDSLENVLTLISRLLEYIVSCKIHTSNNTKNIDMHNRHTKTEYRNKYRQKHQSSIIEVNHADSLLLLIQLIPSFLEVLHHNFERNISDTNRIQWLFQSATRICESITQLMQKISTQQKQLQVENNNDTKTEAPTFDHKIEFSLLHLDKCTRILYQSTQFIFDKFLESSSKYNDNDEHDDRAILADNKNLLAALLSCLSTLFLLNGDQIRAEYTANSIVRNVLLPILQNYQLISNNRSFQCESVLSLMEEDSSNSQIILSSLKCIHNLLGYKHQSSALLSPLIIDITNEGIEEYAGENPLRSILHTSLQDLFDISTISCKIPNSRMNLFKSICETFVAFLNALHQLNLNSTRHNTSAPSPSSSMKLDPTRIPSILKKIKEIFQKCDIHEQKDVYISALNLLQAITITFPKVISSNWNQFLPENQYSNLHCHSASENLMVLEFLVCRRNVKISDREMNNYDLDIPITAVKTVHEIIKAMPIQLWLTTIFIKSVTKSSWSGHNKDTMSAPTFSKRFLGNRVLSAIMILIDIISVHFEECEVSPYSSSHDSYTRRRYDFMEQACILCTCLFSKISIILEKKNNSSSNNYDESIDNLVEKSTNLLKSVGNFFLKICQEEEQQHQPSILNALTIATSTLLKTCIGGSITTNGSLTPLLLPAIKFILSPAHKNKSLFLSSSSSSSSTHHGIIKIAFVQESFYMILLLMKKKENSCFANKQILEVLSHIFRMMPYVIYTEVTLPFFHHHLSSLSTTKEECQEDEPNNLSDVLREILLTDVLLHVASNNKLGTQKRDNSNLCVPFMKLLESLLLGRNDYLNNYVHPANNPKEREDDDDKRRRKMVDFTFLSKEICPQIVRYLSFLINDEGTMKNKSNKFCSNMKISCVTVFGLLRTSDWQQIILATTSSESFDTCSSTSSISSFPSPPGSQIPLGYYQFISPVLSLCISQNNKNNNINSKISVNIRSASYKALGDICSNFLNFDDTSSSITQHLWKVFCDDVSKVLLMGIKETNANVSSKALYAVGNLAIKLSSEDSSSSSPSVFYGMDKKFNNGLENTNNGDNCVECISQFWVTSPTCSFQSIFKSCTEKLHDTKNEKVVSNAIRTIGHLVNIVTIVSSGINRASKRNTTSMVSQEEEKQSYHAVVSTSFIDIVSFLIHRIELSIHESLSSNNNNNVSEEIHQEFRDLSQFVSEREVKPLSWKTRSFIKKHAWGSCHSLLYIFRYIDESNFVDIFTNNDTEGAESHNQEVLSSIKKTTRLAVKNLLFCINYVAIINDKIVLASISTLKSISISMWEWMRTTICNQHHELTEEEEEIFSLGNDALSISLNILYENHINETTKLPSKIFAEMKSLLFPHFLTIANSQDFSDLLRRTDMSSEALEFLYSWILNFEEEERTQQILQQGREESEEEQSFFGKLALALHQLPTHVSSKFDVHIVQKITSRASQEKRTSDIMLSTNLSELSSANIQERMSSDDDDDDEL